MHNKADVPALQALGISRFFRTSEGPVAAVNRVSLSLRAGEFVCLVGPSGSGKTTLLYCLSGLDLPNTGVIMIDGRLFYDAAQRSRFGEDHLAEARMASVGFVFQSYHLLSSLTALENVMVPLRLTGSSRKEARQRARELLDEVDLIHRHDHFPHQLSGGEQQRVAVARAMANRPRVLLADEPTGSLDYENGLRVVRLLRELSTRHRTAVLMVTHIREHSEFTDRVLTMQAGEFVHGRGETG
ncbi:MAG: ABC transporter ATP-binding protein [Bacillota bacterium]